MIAVLLLGSMLSQPAADWESSIQDPGRREAMRLCVPALAARARGEVASVNLISVARSARRTVMRGQMGVLQHPPPPKPGEMAPMHIVNARFAFRCWLSGSRAVRIRVTALRD